MQPVICAQRPGPDGDVELLVAERTAGIFTQQVLLRDTLDAEHIEADYTAGVLTMSIPAHEAAKPRTVEIASQDVEQISPGSCKELRPVTTVRSRRRAPQRCQRRIRPPGEAPETVARLACDPEMKACCWTGDGPPAPADTARRR